MADQQKEDAEWLLQQPQFRRWLFPLIQSARILEPVTDGSDTRYLYHEGRRDLGLEVLATLEEAQPIQHASGLPILTVIQVLREEAQKPATEKRKRERADRFAEIADPDPPHGD
jgi:hypothetical protein